FAGIPKVAFDTVIINSVIQYFPSADYLLAAISGAIDALAPGGSLFIGDVRNLALLESFHTTMALHRAESDLSISQLQSRIQDEMARENELLVRPTFFKALQTKFPRISDIRIQPKLGEHTNELTQYRYDVVLTVGEAPSTETFETVTWQDWRSKALTLEMLGHTLEHSRPDFIALSHIPNSRTRGIQMAIDQLASEQAPETAGELRTVLKQQLLEAIDPQQIWDLAHRFDYTVQFSWLNEQVDGSFDAILCHRQAENLPFVELPVAETVTQPLQALTNNPLQAKRSAELVPQVRGYLQELLPDYMVPTTYVVVDEFPLTPNGKVDRRALPDPDAARQTADYVPLSTPTEIAIAAIWGELLGHDRVGSTDNFFDLGGHSLLATQVMSRLQQDLQVQVPLRALFEATTVAQLAVIVDREQVDSGQTQSSAIQPVQRPNRIPLSFSQQRLWFVRQLMPDSPIYNMPAVVTLDGQLDVEALRRSLSEIVRRHETLRTNIREDDGTPVQTISDDISLTITEIDFQDVPIAEQGERVQQWLRTEAQRPFDISSDPLLRVALVALAEQKHMLSVTMHHIVSDGWSAGVLVRELAALYRAFSAGQPSPLPELPIQYADFAIWQRQHLQGKVLQDLLTYWQEQLNDSPDILELPTDRPRPSVQTFNGAKAPIAIEAELTDSLLQLAGTADATLFMTLLAGFQLTIYAYAQQEKFLLGSPIANRNRPEIEGLVGFFVNTLVLPADLSGDPTFEQLLARVKDSCLGAYSHQDLPFEKLVEALPFQRDLSRAPLVQAAFALQNAASTLLELPGLTVSLADIETATAKVDLTVLLDDVDGNANSSLNGVIEYNTDLFEPSTVAGIISLYQQLLQAVTQHSDRPISEILSVFDLSQFRPRPIESQVDVANESAPLSDPQAQFEQLLEQTNLTANQLLVWLGQQLHPDDPLYNNALGFEIDGAVSPPHLQAAWQTLLRSNDALCLTITSDGSLPCQQVAETSPCQLEVLDFVESEHNGSIADWIERRTRQSFDLSHSPIDGALLKHSEKKWTLFVNVHQIAADGLSLSMLLEQLSDLYELALQDRLPEVLESPTFEDYCEQERLYRQSARYQKARQYWERSLASSDTASYFGRSSHKTSVRSQRNTCSLDRPLSEALKLLAADMASDSQGVNSKVVDNQT
ncbi:MAG: condensation domain-containing protein, partial [Cyanobacteria bacterium P01_E01_bin.45]